MLPNAACSCANAPICGASTFLFASHRFLNAFAAWRHRAGSVNADATYVNTLIRSAEESEAGWLANHEEYAPGVRKEENFAHQMYADTEMFDQDAPMNPNVVRRIRLCPAEGNRPKMS